MRRATTASVVGRKLFYPNVDVDTDLLIAPVPTGIETFHLLRSRRSPERIEFQVELPRGRRLELTRAARGPSRAGPPRREIRILADGREVGTIQPPAATAADGRQVHVTYRTRGNRVVMSIPHRPGATAYPVLVDPFISEEQRYWLTNPNLDFAGWTHAESNPGYVPGYAGDVSWGRGLDNWTWPNAYYDDGMWGEWLFYAPGDWTGAHASEGSYIFKADFGYHSHRTGGGVMFMGLWSQQHGWWEPGVAWRGPQFSDPYHYENPWQWGYPDSYSYHVFCTSAPCGPEVPGQDVGTPGNIAAFGLYTAGSYFRDANTWDEAFMGSSLIFLSDRGSPQFDSPPNPPPAWLDEDALPTVFASDYGLGMKEIRVDAPGWSGQSASSSCTGDRLSRCPRQLRGDFSTNGMPEGQTTATVKARDVISRESSLAWPLKIDHTPPNALNPSGALYQPNGKWVKEGTHHLTLQPTDSYSGVRSSELQAKPGPIGIDGFTRNSTGGWGSADLGGVWSLVGDTTRFSVDGSRGRIDAPQNTPLYALLGSNTARDVDAKAEISYPESPGVGAQTGWLVLRRQSDGRQYRVGLARDGLTQRLSVRGEPAGALFPETDTGLVYEAGARYNIRARITGDGSPDNETRVRVRVWKAGTPEPARWTVDALDALSVGPQAAGGIGLSAESSAPGAATFGFDDLVAVDLDQFRTISMRDDGCGNQGCNTSPTHQFDWQTSGYPEGAYEFRAIAKDPLAYGGAPERHTLVGNPWRVDLDRTPPEISAKRGSLASEEGAIRRGSNDLAVVASDSRSGVKRIEAFVSDADQPGSPRTSLGSQSCIDPEDSCPALTGQFQWDSSQSTWSRIRVAVELTDKADNLTSKDWVVTVRRDSEAPQIEPSLALWDHRNQDGPSGDHRDEGVYDRLNPLQIVATDGGDSAERTGVKSIEILMKREGPEEDFVRKDYVEYLCLLGQCRDSETRDWTLDADTVADGDYTVRVVANDLVGNQSVTDWQVTVDRQGDIYAAHQHAGDPATGQTAIDDEWNRYTTRDARREEDDLVETRDNVPCDASSSGCGETRERSVSVTGDQSEPQTLVIYRGTSPDDARLDAVARVREARDQISGEAPVDTNTLRTCVEAWQRPPPAHGSLCEHYHLSVPDTDTAGNPTTNVLDLWVDQTTKYPLRQILSTAAGDKIPSYFIYERSRLTSDEVPTDFFHVAPPPTEEGRKSVTFGGSTPTGTTTDTETGASFRPYAVGTSTTIAGQPLCLSTSYLVRENDTGAGAEHTDGPSPTPFAAITQVRAVYERAATCSPGTGSLESPELEISTAAPGSTIAALHRSFFVDGVHEIELHPESADETARGGEVPVLVGGVGGQTAVAYVLPFDEVWSGALIEVSGSSLMIVGKFAKSDLPVIAANLRPW